MDLKSDFTQDKGYLIVISAKTRDALKNKIIRYKEFIEKNSNINLNDICYTSYLVDSCFEYRAAIAVNNRKELLAQLTMLNDANMSLSS